MMVNRINKRLAQIAFEYVIIMGFVTFVIICILGIGLLYSNLIKDNIKDNQIESCANKIIATAESVFYSGYPSKSTISCYLPDNLISSSISENNLFLEYRLSSGISKRGFSSNVPISGNPVLIHGVNEIKIEATSSEAVISRV